MERPACADILTQQQQMDKPLQVLTRIDCSSQLVGTLGKVQYGDITGDKGLTKHDCSLMQLWDAFVEEKCVDQRLHAAFQEVLLGGPRRSQYILDAEEQIQGIVLLLEPAGSHILPIPAAMESLADLSTH